MSSKKALGETEKTVLVGALILGFWLGIDAFVKQAEKKGLASAEEEEVPRTAAGRRGLGGEGSPREAERSMSTGSAGSGSRVKDLVVTAAVATMVSAFVSPWVRRWMGDNGLSLAPEPAG